MSDSDDTPVSRRELLLGGGMLATLGLAGTASGAVERSSGDGWVGDFAHLAGASAEQPSPVGDNRLFYWATDSGSVEFTTWDRDDWQPIGGAGSRESVAKGFGTAWRQPDPGRDVEVSVELLIHGSGGNAAQVDIELDDNADGAVDHTLSESTRAFGLTSNPDTEQGRTVTVTVPAGGQYRLRNVADPAAGNAVNEVTELPI